MTENKSAKKVLIETITVEMISVEAFWLTNCYN